MAPNFDAGSYADPCFVVEGRKVVVPAEDGIEPDMAVMHVIPDKVEAMQIPQV